MFSCNFIINKYINYSYIYCHMEYNITPQQLDKMIKPYFDKEFKDATWGEYEYNDGGGKWFGFINQNNVMLVGHPSHDSSTFFTNGHYFSNMWDLFTITPKDFNDSMGRYIKNKYDIPNLKVFFNLF